MMKHACLSILFLSMVAAAGSAYAEDALACETQLVNFKRREYRCLLTANGGGQPIRFKADFAGSHDDTQLSISLTLDDLPVTCSKGSKTWLNGEDGETGDVSLQCHLILDGAAGTQRALRAVVNIYHAGFLGIQLSAP